MPNPAVSDLAEAVQYNCHVSDARHGADDSLCIYLMKMREYFRWEKHLPYGASLEREQVGEWLQAREQLWEELEEAEMRPIEIDGEHYDPFDAEAINADSRRSVWSTAAASATGPSRTSSSARSSSGRRAKATASSWSPTSMPAI
jgi:hypothetical protein